MRIQFLDPAPVTALRYRNARPGSGGSIVVSLPVFVGTVDVLPAGVSALILTSDLQGRELAGPKLVGEVVPRFLAESGVVHDPATAVALLAGDLYAAPAADVRGATGDVRQVWRAFADAFRWVAGVCGNHDLFGEETSDGFARTLGVDILDGSVRDVGGLLVGGVNGIVGKLSRPNRKDEATFSRLLEDVFLESPDVVVLHQGPVGNAPRDKGSIEVRETIEALDAPPLVAFGHCHWEQPLLEVGRAQMLNVDGRVVVLRAA